MTKYFGASIVFSSIFVNNKITRVGLRPYLRHDHDQNTSISWPVKNFKKRDKLLLNQ